MKKARRQSGYQLEEQDTATKMLVFMMQELCISILAYLDNPSLLAMYFTFKFIKLHIEKLIEDQRVDDFSGKKLGIGYLKKRMICESIQLGYQGLYTFFMNIFSRSITYKDISFCNEAVRYGRLEIFKDLRKRRPNVFQWDCYVSLLDAASYRHFELLKHIIEKCGGRKLLAVAPCRTENKILVHDKQLEMGIAAIKGGCQGIINYLDTEKLATFLSVYSCRHATVNNDLKTLRWLREEKGCPWDGVVILRAVQGRNLEILQYALANRCPAPKKLLGERDVKWLNENGYKTVINVF